MGQRQRVSCPANTTHRPNVGPMLAHRLRRWANIGPTLGQRLVLAIVAHKHRLAAQSATAADTYKSLAELNFNRNLCHYAMAFK